MLIYIDKDYKRTLGKKVTGRKFAFLKVFKYKNSYLGDRGMEGEQARLGVTHSPGVMASVSQTLSGV